MPDPGAQSGGIPIALITGATGNLGREIARQFCKAGDRVALNHGHDAEKAGAVAKMCDTVTAKGDRRRIGDQVERSWGRGDFLVNNAGLKRAVSPEDVSGAVVWLARGGSPLTGELLRLDGGFRLQ